MVKTVCMMQYERNIGTKLCLITYPCSHMNSVFVKETVVLQTFCEWRIVYSY